MAGTSSLLQEVLLSDAVLHTCYAHALTTEREEVMGVLIGSFAMTGSTVGPNQRKIARVVDSFIMQRSDKRTDRVEISPEQLCMATERAEQLSDQLGTRVKVCGWYHSHPHITPFPSHVDLATQGTYQQLVERAWVGLIFSVFHSDKQRKSGDCSVHAFASRMDNQGVWARVDVPVRVVPAAAAAGARLLSTPIPPPPAFQGLVRLCENLLDESRQALCASASSHHSNPGGHGDEEAADDLVLQQVLDGALHQQHFKIAHGVVIPQVNVLQTLFLPQLRTRIDSQKRLVQQLAAEEAELDRQLQEEDPLSQ